MRRLSRALNFGKQLNVVEVRNTGQFLKWLKEDEKSSGGLKKKKVLDVVEDLVGDEDDEVEEVVEAVPEPVQLINDQGAIRDEARQTFIDAYHRSLCRRDHRQDRRPWRAGPRPADAATAASALDYGGNAGAPRATGAREEQHKVFAFADLDDNLFPHQEEGRGQ